MHRKNIIFLGDLLSLPPTWTSQTYFKHRIIVYLPNFMRKVIVIIFYKIDNKVILRLWKMQMKVETELKLNFNYK